MITSDIYYVSVLDRTENIAWSNLFKHFFNLQVLFAGSLPLWLERLRLSQAKVRGQALPLVSHMVAGMQPLSASQAH